MALTQSDRAAYAVTAIVVLTVVASGPFVPLSVYPSGTPDIDPGTGSVTLSVERVPERATLERGDYGTNTYHLTVPSVTVRIDSVSETPMLVYKLVVDDLGFASGTTYFLGEQSVGTKRLSMEQKRFDPQEIDRQSYPAEIRILVRSGAGEREILRRNITVEVLE